MYYISLIILYIKDIDFRVDLANNLFQVIDSTKKYFSDSFLMQMYDKSIFFNVLTE